MRRYRGRHRLARVGLHFTPVEWLVAQAEADRWLQEFMSDEGTAS